tara:strand:- start:599 stop:3577 length:2979 start_codon:yes stop_codon:yes gene_type:complete
MVRKSGIGGSGKPDKKFFQHNYVDVIKTITPDLYQDTDFSIYGNEEDLLYSVLGKILKATQDISSLITVTGMDSSSLQQRFILRNNLTHIKPALFENKILKPAGTSFDNFTSREDFKNYLTTTLLPRIHTNVIDSVMITAIGTYDDSVSSVATARDYLSDNLSWFYFLNTSGPPSGYAPSAGVADELSYLFEGKSLKEKDGVGLLFEALWRNREVNSTYLSYIPAAFAKADSLVISDIHASGTQQLKGLQTLLDIWYNPSDENSTTVDDYLSEYLLLGTFSPKQVEAGAFTKFLQAVSFGFYDINTTIQDLEDLVDIERCPPQFLQYLAALIGWQLLTGDVDRWRAQLRKAVFLYKSKGTKRCLEDAISLVFPGSNIDIAENLTENWESFLPRMIYYLIATASPVLDSKSYTAGTLQGVSATQFFSNDADLNYRAATDYVLRVIHKHSPASYTSPEGGAIYINKKKFALSTWDPTDPGFTGFYHRGKANVEVPPWENDRFYDNTFITDDQILILNKLLTEPASSTLVDGSGGGLGIPVEYVGALSSILMKEGLEETVYNLNWNKKWKFYTSGMVVPPNLSSIIQSGDSSKLGLLDYWSSKSSFVYSNLNLNSLQHKIEGVNTEASEVLNSVKSIFKTFAPFHVVIKLFADAEVSETMVSAVSDSMCLNITLENLDMSATGDTDQVILNNFVPSSVEVASDGTIVPYPDSPRATGRRRNFKYNTLHNYFNRNGKAMPIPIVYISASSTEPSKVSHLNVHSTEFIPLGYNFSAGRYFSPSGSHSGIYDASNDVAMSALETHYTGEEGGDPGTEYYLFRGSRLGYTEVPYNYSGVYVSSTFPCRAPMGDPCLAAIDRNDINILNQLKIRKLIYLGKTEDFGEETLRDFNFGTRINLDFYDSGGSYPNSTMLRNNSADSIPYSESEIKLIYSYFNTLVQGKQSRVHTRTVDIYSTSGGARGTFTEHMGGVTSASGGVADAAATGYGTGVNYELSDD